MLTRSSVGPDDTGSDAPEHGAEPATAAAECVTEKPIDGIDTVMLGVAAVQLTVTRDWVGVSEVTPADAVGSLVVTLTTAPLGCTTST